MDSLLDDLLSDEPQSVVSLSNIFESEEQSNEFFSQLPMHIMQLWANNDKVIHIISPTGTSEAIKSVLDNATLQGVAPELMQVFLTLKEQIKYSENPEETQIRVITLKQAINAHELMAVHMWAGDPSINLYSALDKRKLTVQPTMEELRMLLLVNTLLDIREANSAGKVVSASRIPSIVR